MATKEMIIELKVNAGEAIEFANAIHAGKMLTWRGCDNEESILSFDDDTKTILVDKAGLMRALQLLNTAQPDRDIRLV